jgi:hypothetical protein
MFGAAVFAFTLSVFERDRGRVTGGETVFDAAPVLQLGG